MNVLIACEYSAVVRDAFCALGHSAWSCDLLPCEREARFHIQGDCLEAIRDGRPTDGAKWDMMIAHPPCTYLCSSGMHWTVRGLRDPQLTEDALAFVRALLDAPIPMIALENPTGCISTRIRKYDQKIQPWQFGHDASKGTCLWLKGLPKLQATTVIPPAGYSRVKMAIDCIECLECGEPYCIEHQDHYADCACIVPTQDEAHYRTVDGYEFATLETPAHRPVWGNQTPGGQNKLGRSPDRWKERSRTYQGIADAMAAQWGNA